jgi:hypothetical protein
MSEKTVTIEIENDLDNGREERQREYATENDSDW